MPTSGAFTTATRFNVMDSKDWTFSIGYNKKASGFFNGFVYSLRLWSNLVTLSDVVSST
jgi:hypothetical protein